MITLRQIRYFMATAEAGQVSRASADLNVSQSAVSAAIKSLESDLEAQLFERNPAGVTLTYEGHQFLQHAHNIVAAVSEASRALHRSGGNVGGAVSVGVTYTVAGYFLPQILLRFRRVFPRVEVRLKELPRDEIERRLVAGNLDLAVMLVSNLRDREGIGSEVLLSSPRNLWLCTDHPLLARESVSLAEIAREPYVMLNVDEAERTAMTYWSKTPYRPNVIFSTSSVEAVRSKVALGMGITVLSNMVYRPWSLEGQRIELRPVSDRVPSMDVGLAWKRGAEMSEPTRAFHDYLDRSFRGASYGYVKTDVLIPDPAAADGRR